MVTTNDLDMFVCCCSGLYYEDKWKRAIAIHPEIISITSFNEWHEGSQIEEVGICRARISDCDLQAEQLTVLCAYARPNR